MNLTLNTYTQWYWKIDLHNLFHFLGLRADPHAQHEIRVYAQEILEMLKRWVPKSTEAFMEYRLGSYSMSATMMNILRRMLAGESVNQKNSGLTRREWDEFMAALRPPETSEAQQSVLV
jgi:thymidylate synthase (FAD)